MSSDADTATHATTGAASIGEGTPPSGGPAEPTATVGGGQQTSTRPAGSAMPEGGIPPQERPEVQVGAAFAGGLLAALILKKIVS